MAGTNEDYLRRLANDGRKDLLDQIERGEMSIYAAAIEMGYRKRRDAKSRSAHLTHHWTRADLAEKRRFAAENIKSLAPIVRDILQHVKGNSEARESAKKPGK